jgi:hypothetical protein
MIPQSGFHCVWFLTHRSLIDLRRHERKLFWLFTAILLVSSSRGAAAKENPARGVFGRRFD